MDTVTDAEDKIYFRSVQNLRTISSQPPSQDPTKAKKKLVANLHPLPEECLARWLQLKNHRSALAYLAKS